MDDDSTAGRPLARGILDQFCRDFGHPDGLRHVFDPADVSLFIMCFILERIRLDRQVESRSVELNEGCGEPVLLVQPSVPLLLRDRLAFFK